MFVIAEVISKSATDDLQNSTDTQPTPRLLLGQDPTEQLVMKYSMDIMKMDEELNSFQQRWKERRAAMLQRHQQERALGAISLSAAEQPS